MNQLSKIIFLIALAIGSWNCANDPIEMVTINGHNLITCNIDLIKDTCDLILSEITEYCEVVLLDEVPTPNDTNISDYKQVIVSEKYILIIESGKPTLLYRRDGSFIVQVNIDEHTIINTNILRAQIDDKKDRIFLLAAGMRMYVYEITSLSARNIPLAVEDTHNFFLLDSDWIFGTFSNYQSIWGYIQPTLNPRAIYLPSRFQNNLINYYSSSGKFLNHKDKIILDFYSANDTSYYYNHKTRDFRPFLHVYSKKNTVNYDIAYYDSPEGIQEAFKESISERLRLYKQLILVTENHYLLQLREGSVKQIITIDNNTQQAYFLNEVVNDFFGNMFMDHTSWYISHYYHELYTRNGYLTFQYSAAQLREKINNNDVFKTQKNGNTRLANLNNSIEFLNDNHIVLFICKLK